MTGRRRFLYGAGAALALPYVLHARKSRDFKMPGPFPGRVVETLHPASIVNNTPNREIVRDMIRRGMMELTGAPDGVQAWRYFFAKGDVVGLKVNPVGMPLAPTNHEVILEVIAGLESAGVRRRDIVVYDRYRDQFKNAKFDQILSGGVRWEAAAKDYDEIQLAVDVPRDEGTGYDRDVYFEMPLVRPDVNANDPLARRSHVAKFLTRSVDKLINLPVLKDHQSAGVTLALKNLSHGLVNNVSRSHSTASLNACGTFIAGVCALPIIREKTVLHILDGLRGVMQGGPGARRKENVWEHKTLWFATDPVAMDRIGWDVVDARRVEKGLPKVADAEPMQGGSFVNRQPEHVEIAGALGMGVFKREKMDLRKLQLG